MKNHFDCPTSLQKTKSLISFVFLFFAAALITKAQTLTFSVGPSLPYGTYHSTNLQLEAPGMAKLGYQISVLVENNTKGKRISPYVQFTNNNNKIDQDVLVKYYGSTGVQVFQNWKQNLLMTGAKYNFFAPGFDLYLKAGVGMAWMNSFGYSIILSDTTVKPSKAYFVNYNVLKANSLAYNAGIGANIYVRNGLAINFAYDFLYAAGNYGYEKYTDQLGNVIVAQKKVKNDVPLSVGSFTIGLKLLLIEKK